ncbi:MarR family transcriptional regulator [Shewanella colwelliana]|uniref:MarR family transcriptional regulator n=1 Tax=Shewanella colwelliana TaxID=23 RepID=A0A1E5IYU8_SHECO|nr:MarR family transcriptional regulator [Shewanella colwelliana]MDX1282388.1 MarR family transcriptional regulator [Shewanella colwelliana]OEG72254.1 MarR family transcriptional regulator [Shewanella colwelliana]OEG75751.1 MarR family transcriptional regulator [Shewanella colwelliana]GIU31548.1 MarR family transcriptional regulator [Shewanella colwelliana]GIU43313.1 MarR family transcriptional regulator [Shewanella colwelliana]
MKQVDDQLSHEIVEFYEKLSSWEASVVRGKGHSLAQIHTVEILGAHGTMRMKELAEKLGITTGTLTVQINKMVNLGLVERMAHEQDKRSILVQLTTKGYEVYHEHDQLHHQLTHQITEAFSDIERSQLLTFFQRINQGF